MSNSLMNTGMSGLNAAQTILNTISNNITNAYTSGYNRQSVLLAQANGTNSGVGFIGNGVRTVSVTRTYDTFVVEQMRSAQGQSSSISMYYQQISKIDNLLADSSTSLSSQLESFFTSLNNLVSKADDTAARQTVLSSAEALTSQFYSTDKYLRDLETNVNGSVESYIDQINTFSRQIAELNEQIIYMQALSGGSEPLALMDQRDSLVNELNQIIGVTVTESSSGYSISFANGLPLVNSGNAYSLVAKSSDSNPSTLVVSYQHPSGAISEINEKWLNTGELGGILQYRSGPLTEARNQLGLIALALADGFNQQHMAGVDLNDDSGLAMFNFNQPDTLINSKNTGTAVLSASYADVSDIKASDYEISYDGTNWIVTRKSDNAQILPTLSGSTLSFEGIEIAISGTPSAGDKFTLNTVSNLVSSLEVNIKDPALIAAGMAGGGVGDNRNAQALLNLQDEKLVSGNSTLNDAYAAMVSRIGSETNSVRITAEAQGNIYDQLYEQYQSISGVNVDEEYISLQVYLQYYQANAQVIQAATTLFDTILNLRS